MATSLTQNITWAWCTDNYQLLCLSISLEICVFLCHCLVFVSYVLFCNEEYQKKVNKVASQGIYQKKKLDINFSMNSKKF